MKGRNATFCKLWCDFPYEGRILASVECKNCWRILRQVGMMLEWWARGFYGKNEELSWCSSSMAFYLYQYVCSNVLLDMFICSGLVIVCYMTKTPFTEAQRLEMIRYLRSVQCPDGGWGLWVHLLNYKHVCQETECTTHWHKVQQKCGSTNISERLTRILFPLIHVQSAWFHQWAKVHQQKNKQTVR